MEKIEIVDDYEPEFTTIVDQNVDIIANNGGQELGILNDQFVYIEQCTLSLQQIDCLNMTTSVCKIVGVLSVDHNNP